MKLFKRFLVVPAALGLMASFASVESFASSKDKGFYGTIGAGSVSVEDITYSGNDYSVDDGFTLEAGLGYRFNPNFRTEVTYSGNSVEVQGSSLVEDAVSNSLLFNAYYDFANESKWTPYVGAGLGSTAIDTDASSDDDDNTSIYQAKVGITYDAGEKTDVFAEIAKEGYGETNIRNTDIDEFGAWKGQIGLRYFF